MERPTATVEYNNAKESIVSCLFEKLMFLEIFKCMNVISFKPAKLKPIQNLLTSNRFIHKNRSLTRSNYGLPETLIIYYL